MVVNWWDDIEPRRDVMLGKPEFQGTRLVVESILREPGAGIRPGDLFDKDPNLKPEHVRAAIQNAAVGSKESSS